MKTLLNLLLLINLLSCTKEQQIKQLPPIQQEKIIVVEKNINKIKTDEFEIIIPSTLVKEDVDQDDLKLFYTDDLTETIVILTSEYSDLNMESLGIHAIDDLKEIGAYITKIEDVKINDQSFIFVEATRNERLMYGWFTIKNKKSYALSCGFRKTRSQGKVCNSIVKSFKIK